MIFEPKVLAPGPGTRPKAPFRRLQTQSALRGHDPLGLFIYPLKGPRKFSKFILSEEEFFSKVEEARHVREERRLVDRGASVKEEWTHGC